MTGAAGNPLAGASGDIAASAGERKSRLPGYPVVPAESQFHSSPARPWGDPSQFARLAAAARWAAVAFVLGGSGSSRGASAPAAGPSAIPSPAAAALPRSPAIRWIEGAGSRVSIEVDVGVVSSNARGILSREERTPAQWARVLAMFAEQREAARTVAGEVPPMLGTWRVEGTRLRFEPAYPLDPGVRYRAEFHAKELTGMTESLPKAVAFFELPARAATGVTSVVQVYPSAEELPENQLKFYVEFSAPMSRGEAYRHVRLLDAAGREIDQPFLELPEELWDAPMTRLTLLIDPGRIKRGVKPLEDIGPVFESGKTYSLAIDAAWHDAHGQSLGASHRKNFHVGDADRTPPEPARWKVKPPSAGPNQALVVEFDEPMDHALALRLITVANERGEPVAGEARLTGQERRWDFVPARGWKAGRYRLVVRTTIEDLAGNNVGKTFDVDLFEGVQRRIDAPSVSVDFEVK